MVENYLNTKSPPSTIFPVAPQPFDPLDLIGLGLGLTPAGDDFLAGVLYGMAFMEKLYAVKSPRLYELSDTITKSLHLTGEISRHFLRYALAGEWGRNTQGFLTALAGNEAEKLRNATDKKLAIGATSGADEIRGCLYGVQYMTQSQDKARHL